MIFLTFLWNILLILLVIALILSPGLLLYFYHYFKVKLWEQKFLPSTGAKSSYSFMNAYISAAVLMIKLDRRDAAEKKTVLHNRLLNLGADPIELWKTFDQIWDNEIAERRIAKWCVKNLSEAERSELIYLLIELSYLDASLLVREYDFLVKMMKSFKLPLSELKSMMASHRQRMVREQAQKQFDDREQHKTYQKSRKPSKSARDIAFEILGVHPNSNEASIKKAYRTLVKKHHPDRFVRENETVVKAAEARFIEIQKAYELLTES